jgi:hypothetical protein
VTRARNFFEEIMDRSRVYGRERLFQDKGRLRMMAKAECENRDGRGEGLAGAPLSPCESRVDHREATADIVDPSDKNDQKNETATADSTGLAGEVERHTVKSEEGECTAVNYDEENQKEDATVTQASAEVLHAEPDATAPIAEDLQEEAKNIKADKNARRKANKKRKKTEEQLEPTQAICGEGSEACEDKADVGRWTCPKCDEINKGRREQCNNCGTPRDRPGEFHNRREERPLLHSVHENEEYLEEAGESGLRSPQAVQDVINTVRKLMKSGDEAHKQREHEEAMQRYMQACSLLQTVKDEVRTEDTATTAQVVELAVAAQLGMALGLQKRAVRMRRPGEAATAEMCRQKARRLIEGALRLDPGNAEARQRRAQLEE